MSGTWESTLVLGATGRQGGAVARALMERGRSVRAMLRDDGTGAATVLRDQGVDLVRGSLDEPDDLRSAMAGVGGVFSVLPAGLPAGKEVEYGKRIADVAADRGVRHLVYSSGASVGERLTGIARFDAKPLVEAHVRTLPIAWTVVRPMIFMEMLLLPGTGLDQGRFRFFVRDDQLMQLVAVDDIGRLVAGIFADPDRFSGMTIRLASDGVTGSSLKRELSAAAGRSIDYAPFETEFLEARPDYAAMSQSIESGPLSHHADLDLMRSLDSDLLTLASWRRGPGLAALQRALARCGG